MSWRSDIEHFVIAAQAAEAGVREARKRGRAPCPGAEQHAFSWGVCLACGARDPAEPVVPPVYHLSLVEARAVLEATATLAPGPRRRATALVQAAATYFGTTVGVLQGPRGAKHQADARQIAMFVAYTDTELPLGEVGVLFGPRGKPRHHTTVLHAVQKIRASLKTNPLVVDHVDAVRALARTMEETH